MYRSHGTRPGGGYRTRGRRTAGGFDPTTTLLVSMLPFARKILAIPHKHKVVITIALLALNLVNFYELPVVSDIVSEILPHVTPTIQEACLRPEGGRGFSAIVNPKRLIWSAFLHMDEYHLYHNMASLLTKGQQLEMAWGSIEFFFMTAFVLVFAHGLYIYAAAVLDLLGKEQSCAIGFSAVLFGYKTILQMQGARQATSWWESLTNSRISWVELVSIHMVNRNASFLGHVAGIVAGFVYASVRREVRRMLARGARAWRRPQNFGSGRPSSSTAKAKPS